MSLTRGDQPPRIVTPPPGPRARELARRLAEVEAPGVNTVVPGRSPQEGPILWEEALGANVLDVDGNLYIDLTSGFGVAAVGHRHPRVVAALAAQGGRLLHGLGDVHAHPGRVELASRLAALAPMPDAQVFFAISGAEAVEVAIKTAILAAGATGRPRVLAFEPAYHGVTLGALAATSRPEFRRPFAQHLHPHLTRLPYGAPPPEVERELARGDVAGVLLEPIVGREGVLVPPPGWLAAVAALCRTHSVPLIADEVFTGFGRTGSLFAVEPEGVVPDLLCCGKALGGGMPIAAVLGRRTLFRCWEVPGEALHTSTFLGNPLACAAALAVLDVLIEEDLPARAATLGEELGKRLFTWKERFPEVAAVRGRGLLWGIELASRQAAKRLVAQALARGVLLLAGGPEGKVAQIVPPLNIGTEQLGVALGILEETLASSLTIPAWT
ncbi:MAG: LysW-gamma-L-lysine/LysW-L-ornithine aminotransferase [Acidobacteriota bacterium]|nr:LysW-gamma-L-lysine/LysW-L-ornithine aminotransferase [Acidobacteriota bacterium]